MQKKNSRVWIDPRLRQQANDPERNVFPVIIQLNSGVVFTEGMRAQFTENEVKITNASGTFVSASITRRSIKFLEAHDAVNTVELSR